MALHKAIQSQSWLRLLLTGHEGTGKTYSALRIAKGIGPKVGLLDGEHGSANKYARQFAFDTDAPTRFGVDTILGFLAECVAGGYDVAILDCLSTAWAGEGGILELVDNAVVRAQAAGRGGSSFDAWRDVGTPEYHRLVSGILRAPIHIIGTSRVKTEYVIEVNDRGKNVPRKVGQAPVQRPGIGYEFDIVGELTDEHDLIVTKSRCDVLPDTAAPIRNAGEDLGRLLLGWLTDGEPLPPTGPTPASDEQRATIKTRLVALGLDATSGHAAVAGIVGHTNKLTALEAVRVLAVLTTRVTVKELEARIAAMKARGEAKEEGDDPNPPKGGTPRPPETSGANPSAPTSTPTTSPSSTETTPRDLGDVAGEMPAWDRASGSNPADEVRTLPAAPGAAKKVTTISGLTRSITRELVRLGVTDDAARQAALWEAVGHDNPPSHADLERALATLTVRAAEQAQVPVPDAGANEPRHSETEAAAPNS